MSTDNIVFQKGDSIFHRIDPISKFWFVACIALVSIVNQELWIQAVFVVIAAVCALLLADTPFRLYWSFGKVILPFVLAVSFIYPFLHTGQIVGDEAIALHTPIRDLSWSSLAFGVMLGLRFLTFALVGLMYAFTTHPDDIVQAAANRGIPYRIVHAVVIGLVFLPVFVGYAQEIMVAQKIRDLGVESNRFVRWLVRLRHVAFAMLVLGLKKAQITATTLEIKGFGVSKTKTFLHPLYEPRWGKVFGYVCIALTVVFIALRIGPFLQGWTLFWGQRQ